VYGKVTQRRGQLKHFAVDVADDGKQESWTKLFKHLDQVCELVDKEIQSGSSVYIHCSQGQSRSATTVMAYLIKRRGFSYQQAFDHVKAHRSAVHPKEVFIKGLQDIAKTNSGTHSETGDQ
jgi:protein-tyrosine phosphatase